MNISQLTSHLFSLTPYTGTSDGRDDKATLDVGAVVPAVVPAVHVHETAAAEQVTAGVLESLLNRDAKKQADAKLAKKLEGVKKKALSSLSP